MASSSIINANDIVKSEKTEKEEVDIKSHKDIEGFAQWIDEEDARFLAMEDVYNDDTTWGNFVNDKWVIIDVYNDPETGFKGKLYREFGTYNYVFAAAGTQFTSGEDWTANIQQQFRIDTAQYEQARNLAKELVAEYEDCNLIFVGHSLGGGLASAMSRYTGVDAITFNSSALSHPEYKGNESDSKIAAYISNGDILDYVNETLLKQKVEGQVIRRDAKSSSMLNLPTVSPALGLYQAVRGIVIHCDSKL